MTTQNWPLMLNLSEVETLVGIPQSQLRKWLMDPTQIPCAKKIGGRWYMQKFELMKWLDTDLSGLYVP